MDANQQDQYIIDKYIKFVIIYETKHNSECNWSFLNEGTKKTLKY